MPRLSAVDGALQNSGFMVVTGHGVPAEAAATTRRLAREFFALPRQVKAARAVSPLGGRGWLGPEAEASANSEGARARRQRASSGSAHTPTSPP